MSSVKRMFRQQSARVASSSSSSSSSSAATTTTTTSSSSRRSNYEEPLSEHSGSNELEVDEDEEKFVISATDDNTALIRSRRQRPPPAQAAARRAPSHSNSFVCLFSSDRRVPLARGFSTRKPSESAPAAAAVDAGNVKRGVIFRSPSSTGARLRCGVATSSAAGPVVVDSPAKQPRPPRLYSRTPTFDNLAQYGRSVVDGGYRLSHQQRTLIRQCWHAAAAASRKGKPSESPGSFVFRWMFKREPRMKRVFFGLRHIPDDCLATDHDFQRYARAFSDVLELVVDSVGAEQDTGYLLDDTMGPFLCSYGAEHAQMEHSNSAIEDCADSRFRPNDWDIFAAAIREYALDAWRLGPVGSWAPFQKKNEALHAWHVLVHFIVTKVRRGYELEKERLQPIGQQQKRSGANRTRSGCGEVVSNGVS